MSGYCADLDNQIRSLLQIPSVVLTRILLPCRSVSFSTRVDGIPPSPLLDRLDNAVIKHEASPDRESPSAYLRV